MALGTHHMGIGEDSQRAGRFGDGWIYEVVIYSSRATVDSIRRFMSSRFLLSNRHL